MLGDIHSKNVLALYLFVCFTFPIDMFRTIRDNILNILFVLFFFCVYFIYTFYKNSKQNTLYLCTFSTHSESNNNNIYTYQYMEMELLDIYIALKLLLWVDRHGYVEKWKLRLTIFITVVINNIFMANSFYYFI